ncbi:hypothetical protein C8J56DRAFT_879813 [Mycena floridula]|nr:hypothetical protein C8J56DRAFT_879813 [Mycena floridula]
MIYFDSRTRFGCGFVKKDPEPAPNRTVDTLVLTQTEELEDRILGSDPELWFDRVVEGVRNLEVCVRMQGKAIGVRLESDVERVEAVLRRDLRLQEELSTLTDLF